MRKTISIAIIIAFSSISSITVAATFSDVDKTHEHYVAIQFLSDNEIVKGYEDGTFKPEQAVNRAEALKIILESAKIKMEDVEESQFSDVKPDAWFAKYVAVAKAKGIVNGNPDGTFAPSREVSRAEFIKMLLNTNGFKSEKWEGTQIFPDVPVGEWFTPYMNYAGQSGLIVKNESENLIPGQSLNRGEVAETMYVMTIILKGGDTQFLVSQAESQMAQIDIYVVANNPLMAKRAAELSVDMTQQAYKNMPEDKVVLGAAKLARSYDFLMNAYLSGIKGENEDARSWADKAVNKATEAWEVNSDVQAIAKHIKDRAKEVVDQLKD